MALSTDYALRTAAFDPGDRSIEHTGVEGMALEELQRRANERYRMAKGNEPELLVSGSDDFTLFLWQPGDSKNHIARMTGDQHEAVIHAPDSRS